MVRGQALHAFRPQLDQVAAMQPGQLRPGQACPGVARVSLKPCRASRLRASRGRGRVRTGGPLDPTAVVVLSLRLTLATVRCVRKPFGVIGCRSSLATITVGPPVAALIVDPMSWTGHLGSSMRFATTRQLAFVWNHIWGSRQSHMGVIWWSYWGHI